MNRFLFKLAFYIVCLSSVFVYIDIHTWVFACSRFDFQRRAGPVSAVGRSFGWFVWGAMPSPVPAPAVGWCPLVGARAQAAAAAAPPAQSQVEQRSFFMSFRYICEWAASRDEVWVAWVSGPTM